MGFQRKSPADVARRLGERRDRSLSGAGVRASDSWRRETFTLPRDEARAMAQECFVRFPKAAYMTEIESWRELSDGRIQFTIRRLPTAD
ncbi:hypothetical protein [Lichenihabitans psoromatis]|uniref:hypothetical protein n=1 Tax=Lichenihabitans psoromatis TaxID=2528642 RepID=UPI0010383F61|nr:hypothetical protein [Lichenihabitans psoromatis]